MPWSSRGKPPTRRCSRHRPCRRRVRRRRARPARAWRSRGSSPEGLRPLTGVADAWSAARGRGQRAATAHAGAPAPEVVAARIGELSEAARAMLDHVFAHGGEATAGSARRNVLPRGRRQALRRSCSSRRLLVPRAGRPARGARRGRARPARAGARRPSRSTARPRWRARTGAVRLTSVDLPPARAGSSCRRTELLLEVVEAPGRGGAPQRAGSAYASSRRPRIHLHLSTSRHGARGRDRCRRRADRDPRRRRRQPGLGADRRVRHVARRRPRRALGHAGAGLAREPPAALAWSAPAPPTTSPGTRWPPSCPRVLMPETRTMTLAALAALPPGSALASGTGLPSLVARLAWQRPRRPRIARRPGRRGRSPRPRCWA